MREPRIHPPDGSGPGEPFSVLPTDDLKQIRAGLIAAIETEDDPSSDIDFAQRYAAVLLKERGQ